MLTLATYSGQGYGINTLASTIAHENCDSVGGHTPDTVEGNKDPYISNLAGQGNTNNLYAYY